MKIAILLGSISRDSNNGKIANYMLEKYEGLELISLEDLPIYNRDIELEPIEALERVREGLRTADGVIIISPEYNYSLPGVLKNALDWFSRVDLVLQGKPVAVLGASTGRMGTVRAQNHLRQILNSPAFTCPLMAGNEILISQVEAMFNEDQVLVDERIISMLEEFMDEFRDFVDLYRNK